MRARSLIALAAVAPLLLSACGSSSSGTSSTVKSASSAGDTLVVLADDLHLQLSDDIVPIIRTKVASAAAETALDKVTSVLTTDDLIALNKAVDVDRKNPVDVAKEYASEKSITTGLSGGSGKLVVGAANFSESQTLANLFADALDAAGFDASVKPVTSREVYEPALEKGDLDVFPEYAATLTEFLNTKKNGPDATPLASTDITKTVAALKTLATPRGLTVYAPAAATDENAFAVSKNFATANNLTKLSDLKNVKSSLVLGGPPECPTRAFCEIGLQKTYGLTFSSFKALDAGGPLTKQALMKGNIQLGLVFSSDGSLGSL